MTIQLPTTPGALRYARDKTEIKRNFESHRFRSIREPAQRRQRSLRSTSKMAWEPSQRILFCKGSLLCERRFQVPTVSRMVNGVVTEVNRVANRKVSRTVNRVVNVPKIGMRMRMGVSMSMIWAVVMVMFMVVSVSVPGVVAKKAKKGPGSFGLPPAPSSDCDGVAVAKGGATRVADSDDCTKYSLCLTTFGFKLDCPVGQHFSAAEGFCTSPEKAGCDPAFATAAPTPADAAEDAAEAAAEDSADANAESADQAEQPADEVQEVADGAEQGAEDVQKSADDAVDEA
ncbi:hypothetical protein V5799_030659 [Amblyomma americanum]|uniref:Chitin-binding type-2 domain-containing protein n=1 Tax=Amblyomma americanum TaxID=6943 RepID=A0AAQ4EMK4_AMBAM